MLELATTLLLAAHLLAMNVASAGPVIGVWLLWLPLEGSHVRRPLSDRLFRLSLAALVVGSAIGGGMMLLPNAALRSALARFPADAYWFAGMELVFSAGCMAALIVGSETLSRRRWLAAGLAAASAANLLYHFPPLMAVIGELTADPQWASDELLDRRALLHLWRRPEVLSLWVHFSLASVAVAAVAALWPGSGGAPLVAAGAGERIARRLGACALAATVLQLPVGLWTLATQTGAARESMMGQDLAPSVFFAGGVLAALWLLQTLTAVTLGDGRRSIRRAGWLLVAVTVLMSATLRSSRTAAARIMPGGIDVHATPMAAAPADLKKAYSASSASFGSFLDSSKSPPGSLLCAIKSP